MKSSIEQFAVALADKLIRFRWLVLVISILLVGAAASGMPKLQFANNYRVFFGSDNPELNAFLSFQDTFSKNDNILVVMKPKDGKTFSRDMTVLTQEVTDTAWKIPHTRRVDSITNFQYSHAEGDELIVEDLIRDPHALNDAQRAQAAHIAENEPLLYRNLLAADKDTVGINITQHFPEKSLDEVPQTVFAARAMVDEMRAKYPDIQIVLSGGSMMNMAFMEAGMQDMQTLTPLMYLVLIIVMILTVRSFTGTFSALLLVFMSMFAAMGLAGHVGIHLTPISTMAPTVILTLAVADSIHILVSFLERMRAGDSKHDALRESMRINFMPVSITSLTTIVGFLALNTLDTPPFAHLGNITAAGVAFAWLLSLTLLPALVTILPVRTKQRARQGAVNRFLKWHAEFIISHYKRVLAVTMVLAIGLSAMIHRIELNDQWVEYFDYSIPFRADAELAMRELGGTYLVEYGIDAGQVGGVNEPLYLEKLEAFTNWLRAQPEVMHVYSYTDIIKRLNKNMHADDPAWHRVPDNRELAAQYLLLYEMSLPYGLDLNDRVDLDKSSSRLTATLGNKSTAEVRAFLDHSEAWLKANTPEYMHTIPTGPTVMFTFIAERNIEGMFVGNGLAVVAIAFIIMLALRSLNIGLLSLIPNTLPILMTMGIWALTYQQIGMAVATVSAVALGIMVDDSVHFLSKYLRARRVRQLSRPDAIRYAFDTVGLALITTTIILTLGFMVMAMSAFQINMQLGLITAATMVIALIIDFTLLPSLLLIGHKEKKGA